MKTVFQLFMLQAASFKRHPRASTSSAGDERIEYLNGQLDVAGEVEIGIESGVELGVEDGPLMYVQYQ